MKLNYKNISLVFLFLTLAMKGQNKDNKWAIASSIAWVNYSEENAEIVKGEFINQTPRFSIARHVYKNFVFVGSFSTSINDNQKYTTIDGGIRYDFGLSYNNVVPYVVVGGSLINAIGVSATVNGGIGATLWFSENFGLKAQLLYKYVGNSNPDQRAHKMPSFGLVYSFKKRALHPVRWELDN